jgi:hypothetical protein
VEKARFFGLESTPPVKKPRKTAKNRMFGVGERGKTV